jgi:hypothetical protein
VPGRLMPAQGVSVQIPEYTAPFDHVDNRMFSIEILASCRVGRCE